jgi:hypothetical protein
LLLRAIVEGVALFIRVALYARSSTIADAAFTTRRVLGLIGIATHPVRKVTHVFGAVIVVVAVEVDFFA